MATQKRRYRPSTNTLPTKDGPAEAVRSSGWFASLFQRKPKPDPVKEPEHPALSAASVPGSSWWDEWQAVQKACPVGRTFGYLGRTMIVTRMRGYSSGYSALGYGAHTPPTWPAVVTEYADERGEIHQHSFGRQAWPILANSTAPAMTAGASPNTSIAPQAPHEKLRTPSPILP